MRRDAPELGSQLSFQRNENGLRCLVYTEDCTTKTNDGGLNSMHKDRKVVWVYLSENKVRCPVRIIDKYISLLPPVRHGKKANFYLRSLDRFTPAQWFGEQVVGLNTIRKVIRTLAEDSGLEGYFTNYSLRRTGITRLFQAGIDRKLVKEFSGHSSDAVDAYQITSDEQKKKISSVISGEIGTKSYETIAKSDISEAHVRDTELKEPSTEVECNIAADKVDQIACILREIISQNKGKKAKINFSVEIDC